MPDDVTMLLMPLAKLTWPEYDAWADEALQRFRYLSLRLPDPRKFIGFNDIITDDPLCPKWAPPKSRKQLVRAQRRLNYASNVRRRKRRNELRRRAGDAPRDWEG